MVNDYLKFLCAFLLGIGIATFAIFDSGYIIGRKFVRFPVSITIKDVVGYKNDSCAGEWYKTKFYSDGSTRVICDGSSYYGRWR